jgi:hypothetical protein
MGQYTRARQAFLLALSQNDPSERQLPESVEVEARAQLGELERALPRVTVTMEPVDAALAIDGRPLDVTPSSSPDETPTAIAGTSPPGPGARIGRSTFQLVANPGLHVLTVSREGYQDVVLRKTFAAGTTTTLRLELDRLPATLHITSNLADALVHVDDADVGTPPIEVSRGAGRYRVRVTRKGFVPFSAEVSARPGERVELPATLHKENPALTQKWWFWTAIGAAVVGVAIGTYFVTRSDPEPQRPAPDGGGLGWSLRVP